MHSGVELPAVQEMLKSYWGCTDGWHQSRPSPRFIIKNRIIEFAEFVAVDGPVQWSNVRQGAMLHLALLDLLVGNNDRSHEFDGLLHGRTEPALLNHS